MFKVNLLRYSFLIIGLLLPASAASSAETEKTGNPAVVSPVRAVTAPGPAATSIPNSASAVTITPGQVIPEDLRRPLVLQEIAFCQETLTTGIVPAFLTNSTEATIRLSPQGPIKLAADLKARGTMPGSLYWEPMVAFASVRGDLGFTSGPWELERLGDSRLYGEYLSVWEKAPGGGFNLLLHASVSHGPSIFRISTNSVIAQQGVYRPGNVSGEKAAPEMMQTEREFIAALQTQTVDAAYGKYGYFDLLVARDGKSAVSGRGLVSKVLESGDLRGEWKVADSRVSSGGDLGYSYGEVLGTTKRWYLHIWEFESRGGWKLLAQFLIDAK